MKAKIEVTEDDKRFRVIEHEIPEVSEKTIGECLEVAKKEMTEFEYVYQICVKWSNSSSALSQPCYDFFNGMMVDWWNEMEKQTPVS